MKLQIACQYPKPPGFPDIEWRSKPFRSTNRASPPRGLLTVFNGLRQIQPVLCFCRESSLTLEHYFLLILLHSHGRMGLGSLQSLSFSPLPPPQVLPNPYL